MKFESFEQSQMADQNNSSVKKEKQPQKDEDFLKNKSNETSESREEEINPAEVAAQNIQFAESKTVEFGADNQQRSDHIEKGIDLPVENVAAVREEIGLSSRLGKIRDEAKALFERFDKRLSNLLMEGKSVGATVKREKSKMSRRKFLEMGAAALGAMALGKKSEASPGQETRETRPITPFNYDSLLRDTEEYMLARMNLDQPEIALKKNGELFEKYGNMAIDFAQKIIMQKVSLDPSTAEGKEIQAWHRFIEQVLSNREFSESLALSNRVSSSEGGTVIPPGYAVSEMRIGDRSVDALITFSFGRPAEATLRPEAPGAQADLTAMRAAELVMRGRLLPQLDSFKGRWDMGQVGRNDFYFELPIKVRFPQRGLYLIKAYGKYK